MPATRRGDPSCIQRVRNLMQRRTASLPYLTDHRQHIGRVLICQRLDGRDACFGAKR